MKNIEVSDVALFLSEEYYGENYRLLNVTSLDNIEDNVMVFSKKSIIGALSYKALVLVPKDFNYDETLDYSVIKVDNPRLAFAKVVNHLFLEKDIEGIDKSTAIGKQSQIASTVTIGRNCTIGNNVYIGENTRINHNVVVADNCIIADNCYIKSGAIIGEDGFGFDFEKDGTPVRIPHLGKVILGNNVEIGANTVISKGTLDNTTIENNVKIDDQVFIAHNCHIGENTVIIACAEISGSVTIGKNCWIAPNVSIIQKVTIGDSVTVGIGAVVTKDIESHKKVMGLEGLELRPLLKVKKRIDYGK